MLSSLSAFSPTQLSVYLGGISGSRWRQEGNARISHFDLIFAHFADSCSCTDFTSFLRFLSQRVIRCCFYAVQERNTQEPFNTITRHLNHVYTVCTDILCTYTSNMFYKNLNCMNRLHDDNTGASSRGYTVTVAPLTQSYLTILLFLSLSSSPCLSLFPTPVAPFISDQIIFPTHISNQLFPQWL